MHEHAQHAQLPALEYWWQSDGARNSLGQQAKHHCRRHGLSIQTALSVLEKSSSDSAGGSSPQPQRA